jgi:hypothetical protein
MTAIEIYTAIDSQKVGRDTGIKLIENYGLKKQREMIEKATNEIGGYSADVQEALKKINDQLDEMLNRVLGGAN